MERAQFLQGLRTGGPRPSLNVQPNQNVPRFQNSIYDDAQTTQIADALQQMNLGQAMPLALQQQQQLALLQAQAQVAAMMASQGGGAQTQAQALQMQIEMMKLQALQQQQSFQAQLLLQSQIAAGQNRRRSEQHSLLSVVANSAGQDPSVAQTRMTVANQLRARAIGREVSAINAALPEEPHVSPPQPSTPTGSAPRAVSTPLNPNAAAFVGRFNPELAAAIAAASKSPAVSETNSPATPTYGSTTIISGGTSLGSSTAQSPGHSSLSSTPANSYNNLSGYNSPVTPGPTKSDNATSWRRGSITPATPIQAAPPSGFGKPPSPPARALSTSPPPETAFPSAVSRSSLSSISSFASTASLETPSNGTPLSTTKTRPSPLRFSKAGNDEQSRVVVARAGSPSSQSTDGNENDTGSANGSSKGSPTGTTPPSSAHSEENASTLKKEREEASKRLYEGLGLGRPVPSPKTTQFNVHAVPFTLNTNLPTFTTTLATPSPNTLPASASVPHASAPPTARAASLAVAKQELPQPHRQPVGPPSSVDELGPRNFASRLRKKALGGLGVLMDARDRRESYQVGEVMVA